MKNRKKFEDIFKKLTNKRILNNNSDQSSIVEQKYKESIAKTKNKIRTRIKTKIWAICCRENNIKKTKTQWNC